MFAFFMRLKRGRVINYDGKRAFFQAKTISGFARSAS